MHDNADMQMEKRDYSFWDQYGAGLVWSNQHASNAVMIASALLKPNFHLLLEIAAHFGVDTLEKQWDIVKVHTESLNYPEEQKRLAAALPIVTRCLNTFHEVLKANEGVSR
ncbi:MAG: hypothetical protein ABI443_12815 [Chthoniobacterales bacterium]